MGDQNDVPNLVLEKDEGCGVRLLVLNRPRARNALNRALSGALCSALRRAEEEELVRVVVISAAAPVFCAGADIHELRALTPGIAYEQQWLQDWPKALHSMRKPVVMAVDGVALGGGFELVLLADVVFASRKAEFGLPEVGLGTIPGAGGTVRLVEAVGKGRALSMMWSGERMGVEEAARYGIVARVCEDDVLKESLEFARTVAGRSVNAVRMVKDMVRARETEWGTRLGMEQMMYYVSFGTNEFKEGCERFVRRGKGDRGGR
ncbi:Enoyl-CoA hydratase, mitochondrial [Gracilariopsis chorda]|uniref:Enoyl-CoA hydratase, mitochondrial n=1 Tax=Gracilariopsis chorda TaxID=448386 RepID=A0A2V3IRR7_9FLOR|nr:Enoyl-CoA hydratase, mitochondrial [Gracilariopsis chorda]|eukprot:PXF44793.1 Enoyl-CoA hydratase, mitochondrial [Gracilariopsis chorda]